VNFKQDRAIYLQIADYITEHILSGKWKEGDRLPSVRDLAISIEVNPNTVMHTYNYLQEKGIIYNQRGIGYFIADDALNNTRNLGREEFFNEQLPQVFKNMVLLSVAMEEIEKLYDAYKNQTNNRNDVADRTSEVSGSSLEEKT
jgi:GntR family transcriptional regulator